MAEKPTFQAMKAHMGARGEIAAALAVLVLACIPLHAHADAVTVQTAQLLPLGANTCTSVTVPSYKTYVYDNAVDSMDIYVSDASYVAIAGTIGDQSVSFRYMTRRVDSSGTLRVHMDTPSIPVGHIHSMRLTLVSSQPGKPTCIAQVTIVPTWQTGTATGHASPAQGVSRAVDVHRSIGGNMVPAEQSTSTGVLEAALSQQGRGFLKNICEGEGASSRLWTILLAVYFLIIAAAILALPDARPDRITVSLFVLVVLLPLLGLVTFWKVALTCRGTPWPLVISFTIAIMGLAVGFRHHPRFVQAIAQIRK